MDYLGKSLDPNCDYFIAEFDSSSLVKNSSAGSPKLIIVNSLKLIGCQQWRYYSEEKGEGGRMKTNER